MMKQRILRLIGACLMVVLHGCSDGDGTAPGGLRASDIQSTPTATEAPPSPTPAATVAEESPTATAPPAPAATPPPTPTAPLETATETVAPAVSATPTPTATATEEPPSPTPAAPASGPEITYFGVASADDRPVAPIGSDEQGRPIYARLLGSGMSLIVEARGGANRRPPNRNAFDPSGGLPGLQMIVSRPLGDGNPVLCDITEGNFGGVAATVPFAFSAAAEVVDAINDLGCRVNDGTGLQQARSDATSACTRDAQFGFAFVDSATSVQFCLPIAAAWAFAAGDTVVAARVADESGNVGETHEIVVRVASTAPPRTPTPTPTSSTPRPTATPLPPGFGPQITYLGVSTSSDLPLDPIDFDALGRPIYHRPLGQGLALIVEARRGPTGRFPDRSAYDEAGNLPGLQMILSRPLGDGDPEVCDIEPPLFGGVPATLPFRFGGDAEVNEAINDLGCRVNDGTGVPRARDASFPCTRVPVTLDFAFADPRTEVQFCLPIAHAWAFPPGDTIVAARVADGSGLAGVVREMVVRIGEPAGTAAALGR
jgi:hypothetical protein